MQPAQGLPAESLIGKRVGFKTDEEHSTCWHRKVGLKTGVVLKLSQSLAQKAQLMGLEGDIPSELLTEEGAVPRLWVRADPCESFPRGCETAVEQECLMVLPVRP
jgi:hypothetical protein